MPMGLGKCYGVYDPALECWATMWKMGPGLAFCHLWRERAGDIRLREVVALE